MSSVCIPKPAGVPPGVTKTVARDYSGWSQCIGCGRSTTRAACVDRGRFIGHVAPSGECCVGMLVITAQWSQDQLGLGFPPALFDNGDGTCTAEWAVCPSCCEVEQ